ncbi:hypothetical protein ACQP1W_45080 [Spirillospora sp. CA-255316]
MPRQDDPAGPPDPPPGKLLADDAHALRGRVLWRMLYETEGHAEEILSLNIEGR